MTPLTDLVLRKALTQCREWHDDGIHVGVAVNASARNLHDLRFPTRVAELLEELGVDAGWLEIEITENTVQQDPVRSTSVLGHLRSLGVKLTIDDFGTGYSSLAALRRLTIDSIKIDGSFITDLATMPSDLAISRSVIELGRNLGLKTVAEGVETREVLDILRDLGCDEVQGFFVSTPRPAVELLALLQGGRIDLSSRPAVLESRSVS